MDAPTRQLIAALHRSPCRCVLAVTGGGTGAVASLLSVPGGSRTILEVVVPYHEQSLGDFLGRRPEAYCSVNTARDMAMRAHERAGWLAPGEPILGLGCTASLATDRPKKGDHRFHVAVKSGAGLATFSLTLVKGARTREAEEAVLDAVFLNALAGGGGLSERLNVPLLPEETVDCQTMAGDDPLSLFLRNEIPALCVEVDGRFHASQNKPPLLVPGAFNPVHEGHWGLAAAATRLTGLPVAFELSVVNVDKSPLQRDDIRRRLSQFTWHAPVWMTRAATFVEKATLFPGVVFVVGADTAARIVAPRYYQDSEGNMEAALEQIRSQGCRFLVAGRVEPDGRLLQLADLAIPAAFRDLFSAIPESEFRLALSSTQLREKISTPLADP